MEESFSLLNLYFESIGSDLVLCKDRLHKMMLKYEPEKKDSLEKLKNTYKEFKYYFERLDDLIINARLIKEESLPINSTKNLLRIIKDDIDFVYIKKGIKINMNELSFSRDYYIRFYPSFFKGFGFLIAGLSIKKKEIKIKCRKSLNKIVFETGPFQAKSEKYFDKKLINLKSLLEKPDTDEINLIIAREILDKIINCSYRTIKNSKAGFNVIIELSN